MAGIILRRFIYVIPLFVVYTLVSCEKPLLDGALRQDSQGNYNYYVGSSPERMRNKSDLEVAKEVGRINAIKKAYQLTKISFRPSNVIEANWRRYEPGVDYNGMIYSSVKELGTYVGTNVSLYTFATAICNPKSKLYTERINEPPYHGVNCRAYYGTVCSAMVSYALGLTGYGSYDYGDIDVMEDIRYQVPEDVNVADVLWRYGHVAIITDMKFHDNGLVEMIEISEALQNGCVTNRYDRESFNEVVKTQFKAVLRYTELEKNIEYHSCPSIVPVLDEAPEPQNFNVKICVDKGDKSNYLLGEEVTINVFSVYDSIVVYKDEQRYKRMLFDGDSSDIILTNLPYGSYNAKCWSNNTILEETRWIVVDYNVAFELGSLRLCFSSLNSTPYSVRLCDQAGGRKQSSRVLFSRDITDEERNAGIIRIPADKVLNDYRYAQVSFKTDFGIISTRPILTQ